MKNLFPTSQRRLSLTIWREAFLVVCVLAPLILGVLALAMMASTVNGDTPYQAYPGQAWTNSNGYSEGTVADRSVATQNARGVPMTPVVTVFLDAPEAADVDHFMAARSVATAGTLRPASTASVNDTNSATGMPFARNVTVAFNQSTTGTLNITYIDAQGVTQTSEDYSLTDGSTTYTSAWTCRQLLSVNVTAAFTASTTVNVGCGNIFGLPYPAYAKTGLFYDSSGNIKGFVDADGADFPATIDTVTMVAGLPDSTAADDYGTISFADVADGTSDYYFAYLSTFWYVPTNGTENAYPTTSWTGLR